MKNINPYYILPLVILIWAIIAYRVYDYLEPTSPSFTDYKPQNVLKIDSSRFEYALHLDYDNPFRLEREYKSPHKKKTATSKKVAKPVQPPLLDKEDSRFSYKGMMENPTSGKKVGILYIDNKSQLIKVGDQVGDVQIIDFNETQITLYFKNRRIIVQRSIK